MESLYINTYDPSKGLWHMAGWTGSFSILFMMGYSVRKRCAFFKHAGRIRTWLNVHIFFGLLATVLITIHTTLKIGGIVSISYWSMIVTTLSGIVGRYIYVQIPRGISGNELKIEEIDTIIKEMNITICTYPHIARLIDGISMSVEVFDYSKVRKRIISSALSLIKRDLENIQIFKEIKRAITLIPNLSDNEKRSLLFLCKEKVRLNKRVNLLSVSHRIFYYWHIMHLPIALIMFFFMFIHILIVIVFKAY